MKVPINPQTNAPAGQLGYEKPVDVTAGTRALAEVVGGFAKDLEKQQKDRELFDVHRALVDETNNLATDFEAKKTAQPLGAQNFVQQVNAEYNTRHQALVEDFRKRGYSNDAVDEFSSRLGTMRSLYVAQAIDFESKSNYAKVHNDSQQMVIGLTQYAGKNPNAVGSALDEYRVSLTHSGLDQIEQEKLYQTGRTEILQGARDGFVLQHPDAVVQLFDPQHVVSSNANAPDGSVTTITTQAVKPNGQLADNIVAGLVKRGLSDHQARGIAAGIYAESGNDPNVKNKTSGAHGLGQWLGPRQTALFAKYGKNPTGAQQLDFLVSELHGGDAGGKAVLSQDDEVSVLHSYIHDFMRPSESGAKGDISRGLAALGRKVSAHAEATGRALAPIIAGRSYNVEDAIQELGMTADQAQQFVKTGKDTRTQAVLTQAAARPPALGFDDQGKTGIPALDMATEAERFQMLSQARTLVNEHQADAKSAQQQAHQTWYNDFLNKLQDGNLTQVDLNRALAGGQITDYNERMKAQGILDDKVKKNTSLDLFHEMVKAGGKFNPFDDNAQKAADAGFENGLKYEIQHEPANADPFRLALSVWQRTGILPKQGAVMIRGGLVGTDPKQVASAASVANNMIRENPNAFAGVEGQTEIEHAAVAYGHYIYDLGMSPQDASNKVAMENDPKFKEKFKYNDPATQEILKTLRQNGVDATRSFKGATFPNQDTLNEANQTYYELLRDQLNRGLDFGNATAQVNAQMQKVYGPKSNGRIVKYPPERAYPAIRGSWDYIYKDAQKTVKDETGRDPVHVNLAPIPGVTDDDFRNGHLPRYRIIYSYKAGDQTVIDSVAGEFAADVTHATQEASRQSQIDFAKQRAEELKTQTVLEGYKRLAR